MTAGPPGARCPSCSRYAGPTASFCPHCGTRLASPTTRSAPDREVVHVVIGHGERSPIHRFLRLLLVIWLVAYPLVSCGPILLGAGTGGAAGGAAVLGGLVLGWAFFLPWIVGILVLGLLTLLTR